SEGGRPGGPGSVPHQRVADRRAVARLASRLDSPSEVSARWPPVRTRPMTSRWLVRRLGGLLVLAAAISTACREGPKTAAAPIPVKVTPVVQRDVPVYREWIGSTVGYVTA